MKNKIKLARIKIGITQQQLAEKAGVSRQSIIAIESGKYIPSTLLTLKFASIFKKPIEELFELEDEDWR
jgi:putative transcriptional regulator